MPKTRQKKLVTVTVCFALLSIATELIAKKAVERSLMGVHPINVEVNPFECFLISVLPRIKLTVPSCANIIILQFEN